jgi:tight adherence protein C
MDNSSPNDWKERFRENLIVVKVPHKINHLVDEQELFWSGIQMTQHQFVSCWWLLILVGSILVLLMIGFGFRGFIGYIFLIILILLCALGPYLYLRLRIEVRTKELEKSIPDLLDMLTLAIEAGLGFIPALRRIQDFFIDVLGDELRRVLIQMDLGFSKQEALKELTNRLPSSNLNHFVEAILLSERLGTSLAKTMRVQANMLRARRRQKAEIQAQTAPIRIIPALVFFFLPSLLLIYLSPPIINFLLRS